MANTACAPVDKRGRGASRSEEVKWMTELDPQMKRLRWRCRRGMRELDQLFERYLDRAWAQDSEAARAVFLRLLECEDDKLWRWFMGYEACPDAELDATIQRILKLPA